MVILLASIPGIVCDRLTLSTVVAMVEKWREAPDNYSVSILILVVDVRRSRMWGREILLDPQA